MKASPYIRCYVALGSNLGDSSHYLNKAILALENHVAINNLTVSRFYQSKPHGPQDQPDYLNAAVKFDTTLESEFLLNALQKIENDNQRVREGVVRWGARTLDLDLLFYGDMLINTQRLIVPHPRICERAFVLLPLSDLAINQDENLDLALKSLDKASIEECIKALSASSLKDIKEFSL